MPAQTRDIFEECTDGIIEQTLQQQRLSLERSFMTNLNMNQLSTSQRNPNHKPGMWGNEEFKQLVGAASPEPLDGLGANRRQSSEEIPLGDTAKGVTGGEDSKFDTANTRERTNNVQFKKRPSNTSAI